MNVGSSKFFDTQWTLWNLCFLVTFAVSSFVLSATCALRSQLLKCYLCRVGVIVQVLSPPCLLCLYCVCTTPTMPVLCHLYLYSAYYQWHSQGATGALALSFFEVDSNSLRPFCMKLLSFEMLLLFGHPKFYASYAPAYYACILPTMSVCNHPKILRLTSLQIIFTILLSISLN